MSFNSPFDNSKLNQSNHSVEPSSDDSYPIPAYGSAPSVEPTGKTSVMSIVGLVCAVLVPLIGLILSIVAFRVTNETGDNKGIAKAGIIVGAILTAATIIYYIAVFAALGDATIHGTLSTR